MKTWKRYQHLLPDGLNGQSVFETACAVAGVDPTTGQHTRWQQRKGKAYDKRTTARKRLVQALRRKPGLCYSKLMATVKGQMR